MPWPQTRRLLGTKIQRMDGPEKATGRARYTFDINRPGMIHAKILRCPHAHARIRTIDTAAAQKMPGFRAIHNFNTAKPGSEMFFAGAEIVAIACDTEEHCNDALRAIQVDFEVLPFQVREEDGLRLRGQAGTAAPNLMTNVQTGANNQSAGWNANAFDGLTVHEGTYGMPVIGHQCLESHGVVCEWDADLQNLTIWASSQAVPAVATSVTGGLGIPASRIKVITHYMGGGFGSKFGNETENLACAQLARSARAPVKLMLDRAEELSCKGMRPSAFGRVKIGGNKQGDILAFEAQVHCSPGTGNAASVILPYMYNSPIAGAAPKTKSSVRVEVVRLNTQSSRAWRAPSHPQSCVLTDQPIEDLAAKLNLDPLQVRLRNLPQNDPAATPATRWSAIRHTVYTREIQIARELSQWDKKWHRPGADAGPIKTGMGVAMHTWAGTGNNNNDVRVTISNDGSVLVQSSTQDVGSGNRTVLGIVAAEVLGLEVRDITVRIGESPFGASTASGGSSTCPSIAPTTLAATTAARDGLLRVIAGRMNTEPANLRLEPGVIVNNATNARTPWRQACAMLGTETVSEMRRGGGNDTNTGGGGLAPGGGVGGIQIAEVKVDTETGVVRCVNFVAVQDCGLLVNKLCCESQVAGAVIMGVNGALWEERVMDARTGRQCNPDMEFYKLGGIQDMPNIKVHMLDMPERGVIGIGEPPAVSTIAAIGNAVFNAIGRRVAPAPFTPERVLAALAAK
jgi:xanthine dehydrogenase YagR molybdenum-binding subunit